MAKENPLSPPAAPLLTIPRACPLLAGVLLGRYQRFIAEVRLDDGRVVSAHCINPGQMEGLVREGARVWLSEAPIGSKRKLAFTWELVEIEGELVGVNTTVPNRIVEAVLAARLLHGFRGYDRLRREVVYGERSRVDLCLERGKMRHYVEVKNCHLVYPDDRGYFPDSVSVRAAEHLHALMVEVARGHRASVIFTVQVARAKAVRPADAHDPVFAQTAREAHAAGVRFAALRVAATPEAYEVLGRIPVDLAPYATKRVARWREEGRRYAGWQRKLPESFPR